MEITRAQYDDLKKRNLELEHQVKELIDKLNESQQISQIGSWTWDISTNSVEWSEMMHRLLGLKPDEAVPSYELALDHVHEDDKFRYEQVLGEAVNKRENYYLENRIVKNDKSIMNVISRGICICNDKNELVRMVGTVQDVTLIKELMTTNRQLEQFAHILSHDFKTHIRTISNFVGLLKKSTLAKFTEKEKTYFSFIDSGAKKLHDMVDNILEYSKLSSPKLNVSKIYLLEFIESIIFDLKVNLAEKKGEILIGKLPEYIMADRVKLRQVFQNLLSNAIKYTDSKTNPKIEIYAEEDAEHFEFYIKDLNRAFKLH